MANKFLVTIAAASIAGVSLLAGSPAFAQSDPAPSQDQQIHGRILSFDGAYNLQVKDDQGYTDNVEMHQGTIINPTGLTLAPGMVVSINGYGNGPVFDANQIDTPYNMSGPVAYYNNQPWTNFGAGVALGFFFGNTGWWNGGYYGAPAYYNRGIIVYNHPVIGYNNYRTSGYNDRANGYNGNAWNAYAASHGQSYRYVQGDNRATYDQPGPNYVQRASYAAPVNAAPQRPTYTAPVARSYSTPSYGGSVRPAEPTQRYSAPAAPTQRYNAPAAPTQRYSAPAQQHYSAPAASTSHTSSGGDRGNSSARH